MDHSLTNSHNKLYLCYKCQIGGEKIVHYLPFMSVYALSFIIDLWDRCEIVYNWKVKFNEENLIDMRHTQY